MSKSDKPLLELWRELTPLTHNPADGSCPCYTDLGDLAADYHAEIERALEWCARPSKLLERIAELEAERDEWRERATACVRDDLFVRILAALKGE